MPNLGDVSRRDLVGLRGRGRIVWDACPVCGRERWVKTVKTRCVFCVGKARNKELQGWRKNGKHRQDCRCSTCQPIDQYGEKNPFWNGGRMKTKQGYILVLLSPDDPLRSMADENSYVMEHRLVVARKLDRPLVKGETVHHKNGNKSDNRLDNLELWFTNHGHGVRVEDVLKDWARLYDYHCPDCNCQRGGTRE